jgi:SOS-response transcriptional repressor LexA
MASTSPYNEITQCPLTFDLDRLLSLTGQPTRFQSSLRDAMQAIKGDSSYVDAAGEDCRRACDLLEQDDTPAPYARAVLYLFCTEIFRCNDRYRDADLLADFALDNVLSTDPHLATVAYLIQGNVNQELNPLKAKDAYDQALSQLTALHKSEKGLGRLQRESFLEELGRSVKERIAKQERIISEGSRQVHFRQVKGSERCSGFCHTKSLPILGKIAAGEPINHQVASEWLNLPDSQTYRADFILQVQGQSMIEVDINDGDYVLMRNPDEDPPGNYAELHRAIVAVEISGRDDEATLKSLICEGDDYLVLWPENDSETVRIIIRRPGIDAKVKKIEDRLVRKGRKVELIPQSKVDDVLIRARLVGLYDPKTGHVTKRS